MGLEASVAEAEGTKGCVRGGWCYCGHWSDPVQGLGHGHRDAAFTLHKGNGSFVCRCQGSLGCMLFLCLQSSHLNGVGGLCLCCVPGVCPQRAQLGAALERPWMLSPTSVTALDFAFLSLDLTETAVKAVLDGEGAYFVPNLWFPSNRSAAMQRNTRDTMTNTLNSILFAPWLRQMRVVTLQIPTYEHTNLVHSNKDWPDERWRAHQASAIPFKAFLTFV